MVTSQAAKAVSAANDTDADTVAVDQDALTLTDLAKGVLARDFRPRTASVRRLAEAVLAQEAAVAKRKRKKASKKRRLAKIPGQKGKKKKG